MPEPSMENIIKISFYYSRKITLEEYGERAVVYISRDTGYGIETDKGDFDVLVSNEYIHECLIVHENKTYRYLWSHLDEIGLKYVYLYIRKI